MSARLTPLTDTVVRCVARQDGGFLIITRTGLHAVATEEIPVDARVVIRDGQAVRAIR